MPPPITNNDAIATGYEGNAAKLTAPAVPARNAAIMTRFSLQRSKANPAGMDITP